MKRMNLLPADLRPREGSRRGASYLVIGSLGVAIVAMLAYGFVIGDVRGVENEVAQLEEEAHQAQAQVEALAPYAAFADMKQTRANSVRGVAQTRFDYERLTRELARVLPEGVSVSQLSVAPGAPTAEDAARGADNADGVGEPAPAMELSGCAPSQNAVADTLDRLRALTSATNVSLHSSGRSGGGSPAASGGGGAPYLVQASAGAGSCDAAGSVSFDANVTLETPGSAVSPGGTGS